MPALFTIGEDVTDPTTGQTGTVIDTYPGGLVVAFDNETRYCQPEEVT